MKVKTGEDNIRYLLGLTPKQYEMFVKLNEVNENDLSSREIQKLTNLEGVKKLGYKFIAYGNDTYAIKYFFDNLYNSL